MSIFVQIAAYRDAELGPTVRDCLAKAKWPAELRFGICLQDELDTDYGLKFNDPRLRIIHVPWQESKGVCWARHQAQSLYDGETYMLQIDSHHRFAKNWDELLLGDFERCGSEQAILSTYPGSYDPVTNECAISAPNKILVSRFDHKGSLKRYPLGYKAKNDLSPIPARFLAAGFLFARGQFIDDIPYDPELYFAGEEPSLTVRAYSHGYDIYHPQQNILWHEYVRKSKPKHWFDHAERKADVNSREDNKITQHESSDMECFYSMLENNDQSKYGLGSARSVHDYECFAGLSFDHRVVHLNTRLGIDPVEVSRQEWEVNNKTAIDERQRLKHWLTRINLSDFISALESAKFGIVSYFDRDNQMIDRVTLNKQNSISNGIFEQKLESAAPPSYWVLTGFTQSNQWEQIASKPIPDYRLLA